MSPPCPAYRNLTETSRLRPGLAVALLTIVLGFPSTAVIADADNLKAFPPAAAGMARHVIERQHRKNSARQANPG